MPLALKDLLAPRLRMVVMRISRVFRKLCNKVWNPLDIKSFQLYVSVSLALLDIHFPPSFFDITIHLLYHLVNELDLCGLVATRWMYLVERYMKTLKLYVRNMVRPKASMAKGYVRDECLSFIIEYLQRFDVVKRKIWDVNEEGDVGEVLKGAGIEFLMNNTLWDLAHQYLLDNSAIMMPWT